MTTKRTIPASAATAGRSYLSPRGTRLRVLGPVEGSTDVRVENEHGRPFTVQEAYPLEPLDQDGPALESLVGLEGDALANAVAQLELEDLDALEDLDPRPAVLEATAARRAELEGGSTPEAELAPCPECGQAVATMDSRGRQVLRVHQGTDGSYCSGSGTPVGQAAPAPEPEPVTTTPAPTPAPTPEPAPAPAELETETPEPTEADPMRHLDGAETASERIDAIRRVQSLEALDELETVREDLQAKAGREIGRHRKALEAIEDAGQAALEGDTSDLDRLTARKDYQGRPGAMARARVFYAQLQAKGEPVDPGVRPVDPSELEDPELPAELTTRTAPAELRDLVGWLEAWTNRTAHPTDLVKDVAAMTGTVRESRQALADQEDLGRVRLAWAWECYRRDRDRRPTVLDQLESKIAALGGEVSERPLVGQTDLLAESKAATVLAKAREEASHPLTHPHQVKSMAAEVLAELERLGDSRPPAFMAGLRGSPVPDGADPLDVELHALGLEGFQELVDAGVVQPVEAKAAEDQVGPEPEPAPEPAEDAPTASWDLSSLPLEDQVARSTAARALELVAALERPGLVFKAMVAEQAGRNRPEVMAALEARRVELVAAEPAPSPAPELEAAGPATREAKAPRPEPAPSPAPAGHVQVKDLDVLELPDGRRELWARPEGQRPVRLGDYDDPRLAQARQALEAYQARQAPPPAPSAPSVAPPPQVDQGAVHAAQAALASLAAGLPALAAMGIEVEIKITTKSRLS